VPKDSRFLCDCCFAERFAISTEIMLWENFPVEVYVDTSSLPREHRRTYLEGIARGVGLWSEATRGKIGSVRLNFDRP
jgi:hypothetical protein